MKIWLKILIALVVVLLIIQIPIFNPEKNYTDTDTDIDITDKYDVPMNIQMDLYGSCYHCHSNYTEDYPWYYHIQPVSWWMDYHIREGKEHLNFSEFAAYPRDTVVKKFKDLQLAMEYKTMPLKSFLWMHEDAKLTEEQYQNIAEWAEKMHEEVKNKN